MSRRHRDNWEDRIFEDEYAGPDYGRYREDEWRHKGARFMRYLATRRIECWGFFAAGFFIAKILF